MDNIHGKLSALAVEMAVMMDVRTDVVMDVICLPWFVVPTLTLRDSFGKPRTFRGRAASLR